MSSQGDQGELKSSHSSFPWNIAQSQILERYEGFDYQPMTPPSNEILKEPPRIKARRSKYWSFLGEQEKIPEKSEVKTVIPTDLRTYISPQDGEEVTYIQPKFYTPAVTTPDYTDTEMKVGDITSEVMNQRLSAGSSCDEESMETLHQSLRQNLSEDNMIMDMFEDVVADSSSQEDFQMQHQNSMELPATNSGSDSNLGHQLSFSNLFSRSSSDTEDADSNNVGYRKRSLSTTDLMSKPKEPAHSTLMSKIHNRFSASAEALRKMNIQNFRRSRHASGPEVSSTSSSAEKKEPEPEHHTVARNAMLLSS